LAKSKAKAGKLTHSPGLYGYEFDKETDTLHIIEEEAKIIDLCINGLLLMKTPVLMK